QHVPDHLEVAVVVQSLLRGDTGGYHYRKDDVAVLLALRQAHHSAHGLDHVHHGAAGVEEHDCVQGGDVHPLGQTTGIGEHPAGIAVRVLFQPVQELSAL